MNAHLKNILSVIIIITLSFNVSAQSPIVGTWKLKSDWGKDDSEGIQIMMVNTDLTGTVNDVENGWITELRNVELKDDALSFTFYFEDIKDYEVKFSGTLVGKEINGEFEIWGAKAAVTGAPLSAEETADNEDARAKCK